MPLANRKARAWPNPFCKIIAGRPAASLANLALSLLSLLISSRRKRNVAVPVCCHWNLLCRPFGSHLTSIIPRPSVRSPPICICVDMALHTKFLTTFGNGPSPPRSFLRKEHQAIQDRIRRKQFLVAKGTLLGGPGLNIDLDLRLNFGGGLNQEGKILVRHEDQPGHLGCHRLKGIFQII